MYYKLNESELNTIEKVSDITLTDYEIKGNLIDVDKFITIIEDMICEYHNQEEKYDDFKKTIDDCFEPIPPEDEYGINDNDFI